MYLKTRLLAMLLALMMVLGMVATASAADGAAMTMDYETAGTQVTVTVAVTKGSSLTNGQLTVNYDAAALVLTNAYAADVCTIASVNGNTAGKIVLAWVGSDLTDESTVLLTAVFTAKNPGADTTLTTTFGGKTTELTVEGRANPFTDIEGHWAEEEILATYYAGLFTGVTETTFAPELDITRAMFVTVLYRMEGEPNVDTSKLAFSDVGAKMYYAPAVVWATEAGVTNGTSSTTFSPEEEITRQQLVTMLYRYAQYKGEDVSGSKDLSQFADGNEVDSWAKPAMSWALAEGLLKGYEDGTVRPEDTATRAQTAAILCRYADLI